MIKHTTIFSMNSAEVDASARMWAALERAAKASPLVVEAEGGIMLPPEKTTDSDSVEAHEGPVWGDVIQILSFASREDADAYPRSREHALLLAETEGLVASATAIDFEVE